MAAGFDLEEYAVAANALPVFRRDVSQTFDVSRKALFERLEPFRHPSRIGLGQIPQILRWPWALIQRP